MTADNIEDLLNIDKVRALEKIFTYFEQENKRCMDMLEFRTAMRKVGPYDYVMHIQTTKPLQRLMFAWPLNPSPIGTNSLGNQCR